MSQFTRVTDRQTDRGTDGRTDGRTDRNLITIPRLHYMQRGKNRWCPKNSIIFSIVLTNDTSIITAQPISLFRSSDTDCKIDHFP